MDNFYFTVLFYKIMWLVAVSDAEWYAEQLKEIGIEMVGFCCGNCPAYTRALAMVFGRNPPAAE